MNFVSIPTLTRRPDLPISLSEETKVGLGLWNNKTATMIVEAIIFFIGVGMYASMTKAENRTGKYALWSLVIIFLVIYFMNAFGDPPPDEKTLAYVGLAQWLFILWGYWVDRNRTTRETAISV